MQRLSGKSASKREPKGDTLTIGSPPLCHPTGRAYELLSGSFRTVPVLSADERAELIAIALSYDQRGAEFDDSSPVPRQGKSDSSNGDRPGDLFNKTATWPGILKPHGWTRVKTVNGVVFWRRPGKHSGTSATTDYNQCGLFYCFTSNGWPFEEGHAYSKFAAWTLLEHGGDYTAAARELWRLGK